MACGLAALQRWLGRTQLWLSSALGRQRAVFTSAVLLFLVCHDTLAYLCLKHKLAESLRIAHQTPGKNLDTAMSKENLGLGDE